MAHIPALWAPYLKGQCFDFALALHELMPAAEFVAIGDAQYPDHVALRVGSDYFDIRGRQSFAELIHGMRGAGQRTESDVVLVTAADVAFHCGFAGLTAPYPRLPRKLAKSRLPAMAPGSPVTLDADPQGSPLTRRRTP